jgi:hypothetical protein
MDHGLILSNKSISAEFQRKIQIIHPNSVILVFQIVKEEKHPRMKWRATVSNIFFGNWYITKKKAICESLITYCIGKKSITLTFVIDSLFISMTFWNTEGSPKLSTAYTLSLLQLQKFLSTDHYLAVDLLLDT